MPFPTVLFNEICPPIISTRCFVIVSPRPVPPYFLDVEASACANLENIKLWRSSGIPIPVSSISRWSVSFLSSVFSIFRRTAIYPCSVNLIELLIRLFNICWMRRGSPRWYPFVCCEIWVKIFNPFLVAEPFKRWTLCRTIFAPIFF